MKCSLGISKETAISHIIIGEDAKRQLEKLLAYDNANQECQKAIAPIREKGTIIDYLKACHNLGSETQKVQMLAETMVAPLRKGNEGCFTCGDKNHLERDCLKKVKNLQKSALAAIEECIGPKIVSLNLTLKENLFRKTPSRGPPRSLSTKTRGKFHLFPQTLNSWPHCSRYTSPKCLSPLPPGSPLWNTYRTFWTPAPNKPLVCYLADLV